MQANEKGVHAMDAPAADPSQESEVTLAVATDTHLPCRLCDTGMRPKVRPGSSRWFDLCYPCQKQVMGVNW